MARVAADREPDPRLGAALPPDHDLLSRAADALADAADDATARRVLDAARVTFTTFGIRRTTMDDVAKRAGVGRATIYRKFETKEALVEAVLLDELRLYLQRLDAITEDVEGFGEQLVEGFVATLHHVREESLLSAVVELDGEWGMGHFTVLAGPVIAAAREYLARKIRAAQAKGDAVDVDPEPVAELMVRLCHSLMLTPEGVIPHDDADGARAFARAVLVPILVPR